MMNYTLEAEAREQHKKDTTAYMNSYNATGGGQYNPPPDMLPGDLFNTHPGHPSVITERPDIPQLIQLKNIQPQLQSLKKMQPQLRRSRSHSHNFKPTATPTATDRRRRQLLLLKIAEWSL